jgi:hypothetical protein
MSSERMTASVEASSRDRCQPVCRRDIEPIWGQTQGPIDGKIPTMNSPTPPADDLGGHQGGGESRIGQRTAGDRPDQDRVKEDARSMILIRRRWATIDDGAEAPGGRASVAVVELLS